MLEMKQDVGMSSSFSDISRFRCVNIGANFDADMVEARRVAVEMELNQVSAPPTLVMLIDSGGGSHHVLGEGLEFFRRDSMITCATVVTSDCYSAAVPLCAAGNKGLRLALPQARFMVHPMRIEASFSGSFLTYHKRVQTYHENDWTRQNEYIAFLAKLSGQSSEFWREKIFGPDAATNPDGEYETCFTAEEALAWGCIDRICDGMDEVMHHIRTE